MFKVCICSFIFSRIVELCSSYPNLSNLRQHHLTFSSICQALPTVDELAKLEEQIKDRSDGENELTTSRYLGRPQKSCSMDPWKYIEGFDQYLF